MEKQPVPDIIRKILTARGFESEEDIQTFLFSGISSLSDPFSIPDMKKACQLLMAAAERGEKIFVYGDGDVDGICATFLILSFLDTIGSEASFYLTHRLEENYEIEESFISDLKKNGYTLLITVDCGISSIGALRKAEEYGIKCIVLDHHPADPGNLPGFHVYINPCMMGWDESVSNLCGAGISFKFTAGMEQLFPGFRDKKISDMIEIACLATLADFVPLSGENRIFVKEGLKRLHFTSIRGLAAIMEYYNIKPPLYARDITMKLNPKLNSPGRIGKPEIVLELLLEKDEASIRKLIAEIDRIDRERYRQIAKIMKEIEKSGEAETGFIVSGGNCRGYGGIIASRLAGKYKKPFMVCYEKDAKLRGSIRTPDGFYLTGISAEMEEYMDEMGGHRNAMGFKCSSVHMEKLKKIWINARWETDVPMNWDCELELEELSPLLIKEILQYMEPFGKGNPAPLFLCREVCLKSIRSEEPAEKKLWAKKGNSFFEAYIEDSSAFTKTGGEKADICYTPYLREFSGLYRIFIKIADIINHSTGSAG